MQRRASFDGLAGSIWFWAAILSMLVLLQVGCTLIFTGQRWSMPVGLAAIIACCGVIVLLSTPIGGPDRWRWRVIAAGMFFWSLMFIAIAYQDNFLDGHQEYSSLLGGMKQLCFIVVLLSTGAREDLLSFRAVDVFQSALFVVLAILTTWGSPVYNITVFNTNVVKLGYALIVVLSIISYFGQERALAKRFVFNIIILQISYGIISSLAGYIVDRHEVTSNSPIWVIGDFTFVLYGLLSARLYGRRDQAEAVVEDIGPEYRRHLPPLFIAIVLLAMAFDIDAWNPLLGAGFGLAGLISYAIRTTMLLDRYLKARDLLIVAEQRHLQLLVDMIHEVRAPLGSMVLNATMLRGSVKLPEHQARCVDQIGVGGARVTTMLNDVLDIERIDAGLIGTEVAECDLTAIVGSAVAVVMPLAATAAVTINVDSGIDRRAHGDGAQLERVFVNLLTNAVRFTRSGGTITVAIEDTGRDMTVVRIQDNGVGIAPDLLPTLFQRFSAIGIPLNGHRGSGLGLSICRGLMTAMGGRIELASILDEGTTVTVHVPKA